jgi:hypothetical protein
LLIRRGKGGKKLTFGLILRNVLCMGETQAKGKERLS